MTTPDLPNQPAAAAAKNYLNQTTGFRSWAFTLDHKRIGVMYLISVLTSFFFGGISMSTFL